MKAEIIATGTELLLGEITDTNTPFIAGRLAALGIDLYYASTVGDNLDRLVGALRQAWQRSDLVILTGGLGPTHGDLTRQVIADLLGEELAVEEGLKQDLMAYFDRMHMDMPESNIKQATIIPSAVALTNRRGTAPGWWVEKQGRLIIALPGPPAEMQAMWQNEVLPKLERKAGGIILSRTLKTLGLSEAKVNEMVLPFLSAADPTLAIYAKPDGIHLRITAKAADRETAGKIVAGREIEVREVMKDYIWGADDDTMEGVIGGLLAGKRLTLAVAESFTGGFLSSILAGSTQSPSYFKGAIVVTSGESREILGLKPATPSTETAAEMASLARTKLKADIGIGVDGIPLSDAAFIAIDFSEQSLKETLRTRPNTLVRRASYQALFSLRSYLLRSKSNQL